MGKLKLILPILLVLLAVAGGAYHFVLTPKASAKKAPAPHVEGDLFALAPEFVVNLTDGHYGKVTVALLLKQAPSAAQLVPVSDTPKLLQDPVVRATITDDLTGVQTDDLINRSKRTALRAQILKNLQKATDIEVTGVLFTDVVVQ
jgi:flagellar basal body-associated protein FliL